MARPYADSPVQATARVEALIATLIRKVSSYGKVLTSEYLTGMQTGNEWLTICVLKSRTIKETLVDVIHFFAKSLRLYQPASPCLVDVARTLAFADTLDSDASSVYACSGQ